MQKWLATSLDGGLNLLPRNAYHSINGLLICLLIGLATSLNCFADKPPIRALLIGIDSYRDSTWGPLHGTRDVKQMSELLQHSYGVAADNLAVLPEAQATRAGIEKALGALVAHAEPGETVIFFYSGHGSVLLAEPGQSQEDRLAECLVPIDTPSFKANEYPERVVRDRFIEQTLTELVQKVRAGGAKGSVVFILDCCHSGGLSRGSFDPSVKVRTNPAVLQHFLKIAAAQPTASPSALRLPHRAGPNGWVVLSACRADQTAADDPVSFTMLLANALQELPAGGNYNELIERVNQLALAEPHIHGGQSPQASGDRDLEVFGGQAKTGTEAVRVRRVEAIDNDLLLTFDRGRLAGFGEGTTLAIYPANVRNPDPAKSLGEVVVESADLFSATATVAGAKKKLPNFTNGWGSISKLKLGFRRLRLYLDPTLRSTPLARSLAKETSLLVLEPKQERSDAKLVRAGGKIYLELPVLGGQASHVCDDATTEALLPKLKGLARRLILTSAVVSDKSISMKMIAGRWKWDQQLRVFEPQMEAANPVSKGTQQFYSGDQACLEITNRGSRPMYLTVLHLDGGGAMDIVYPAKEEWESAKPLQVGRKLAIDLAFQAGSTQEFDGYKVLATYEPVNRLLLARGQGQAGVLSELVSQVVGGSLPRGAAQKDQEISPTDLVLSAMLWVCVVPRN